MIPLPYKRVIESQSTFLRFVNVRWGYIAVRGEAIVKSREDGFPWEGDVFLGEIKMCETGVVKEDCDVKTPSHRLAILMMLTTGIWYDFSYIT